MHFEEINYSKRSEADSLLELAWKFEQNRANIKRWFGTGVLFGGNPSLISRDRTDSKDIIARYIFYKPVSMFRTEPFPATDNTVSRYTVLADGTVNCWIEGSKTEFLPQGIQDSTIVSELRPAYESTADIDRIVATKFISFGTPIMGFISHDQIYYDATDTYEVRGNDGTRWIYMNRDEDFFESKNEMDASNYMLLWAVKLCQLKTTDPSYGRAVQEVQDRRTLIPKAFGDFRRNPFKDPVAGRGDLPFAGAEEGDLRITTDTDSGTLWVFNTGGWTTLDPPHGAFAKEAFRTIRFQGTSSTFTAFADSSADEIIFSEGPHIDLVGAPAADTITVHFRPNMDLNAKTSVFKNVKHMDTTGMHVKMRRGGTGRDAGKITDATAKIAFLDSKDTMTVRRHAELNDLKVLDSMDMTKTHWAMLASRMTMMDSQFDIYGSMEVNNIEVINLINQINPGSHSSRHETGGLDEVDITDMQGVLRDGQDVGWITTWRANWRINDGRQYMHRVNPFPPTDTTVTRYYSLGDGTVNCWIDGIKHEFMPTTSGIDGKNYDSTIVSDLRAVRYSDSTVLDVEPGTNAFLIWDEKNKYWRPHIFN